MQIVHDLVSFLGMVCTQALSVGPGSQWAQGLGGPRVSRWAQALSVGPGSQWAQGLGGPRVSETTVSLGLSPSQTILPHIVWE